MSSSVSSVRLSSTWITPSLPTFSMALAMISPISLSPFAEMVPTWAIMSPLTRLDELWILSTTVLTALSMPRFSSIGLEPAVTFRRPSR